MPMDIVSNWPPELLAAPLYRFSEALGNMGKDPDWTGPEVEELRGWLAEVEPDIHQLAELCQAEDPPDRILTGNPCENIPHYRPLINLFQVLPGVHALDNDVDGALKAMRSGSRIAAYHTRSDRLIGWLVGHSLSEISTRACLGLYACNLITPAVAGELEQIFAEWQANKGAGLRANAGEHRNQERMTDVIWNKAEMGGPIHWGSGSMDGDCWDSNTFERQAWKLRRLGWATGNGYRAVRKAQLNLHERLQIEAAIWADASIEDPAEMADVLVEFETKRLWPFKKGWLETVLTPDYSSFYGKYLATDAAHRIGHALAAIGAYKNVHQTLPISLQEAYVVAGLNPDLQTPYVDQAPAYQRLDVGAPDETNAYAFALTIWGDGGRCDAKGGISWLVVWNPAFGDQSLRCWRWLVLVSPLSGNVESQEVKLVEGIEQEDAPPVQSQNCLAVPAALLGADVARISDAEQTMGKHGWQEIPISPRRNRR